MKFDINSMINKGALAVKRRTPEILVFAGIGGMVVSAFMACKATRRLDPVLETHKKNVDAVHKRYQVIRNEQAEKKAMTKVYFKTGMECVKLYAPSVGIGVLSITSILTSNNMIRKQNVALAAAYAAIDTSFKQYRSRVVERFGEDVDRELRFNGHQEKIEVVETNEKGEEKKVKKTVTVVEPEHSDYARYFVYGEAAAAEQNYDYNKLFLKSQQELANHILRAHGYLFLNDVYDMLGIEKSLAGQAVGWVYDKDVDDHGDNYVDFGIQEVYRKRSDEPNDYEKVFLLDFNVDGSILNHALEKGLIKK